MKTSIMFLGTDMNTTTQQQETGSTEMVANQPPAPLQEATPGIPHVFTAINAVQKDISQEGISKDRESTGYGAKYSFRGIDDVYNAISPLLAKHGLIIMPEYFDREVIERKSNKGGALFYTTLTGKFTFISMKDGSKYCCTTYGEAMDSGDKGANKAMSIAYKYACFQVFAIPTEGDNDPDGTTHPPIQPNNQQQNFNNQTNNGYGQNNNQGYQNQQSQQQPQANGTGVAIPWPADAVVQTANGGKHYDSQQRRIWSPEQFNNMCNAIINGTYPKAQFMDQNKYLYSNAQWQTLLSI